MAAAWQVIHWSITDMHRVWIREVKDWQICRLCAARRLCVLEMRPQMDAHSAQQSLTFLWVRESWGRVTCQTAANPTPSGVWPSVRLTWLNKLFWTCCFSVKLPKLALEEKINNESNYFIRARNIWLFSVGFENPQKLAADHSVCAAVQHSLRTVRSAQRRKKTRERFFGRIVCMCVCLCVSKWNLFWLRFQGQVLFLWNSGKNVWDNWTVLRCKTVQWIIFLPKHCRTHKHTFRPIWKPELSRGDRGLVWFRSGVCPQEMVGYTNMKAFFWLEADLPVKLAACSWGTWCKLSINRKIFQSELRSVWNSRLRQFRVARNKEFGLLEKDLSCRVDFR